MNQTLKLSVGCAALGLALSLVCLAKTTPLIMTAFFFIGLPAFGAGALLCLAFLLRRVGRGRP